MKKILFTLLAVFALTSLSSCQKDDDGGGSSDDIVGTSWRGLVYEETWNGIIYNDYETITFGSNNKVTLKHEGYVNGVLDPEETETFQGTYKYNGSNGSITSTDTEGDTETVDFSISGNTLTVNVGKVLIFKKI